MSISETPVVVPQKPRLGVAVLVTSPKGILLGRRAKTPNQGKWIIPGGGVKWGETFVQAGAREIKEEAGLVVNVDASNPHVVEVVNPPDEHRVIMYVQASYDGGEEPQASSDLDAVRFFTKEDILTLELSDVVRPVLKRFGWIS